MKDATMVFYRNPFQIVFYNNLLYICIQNRIHMAKKSVKKDEQAIELISDCEQLAVLSVHDIEKLIVTLRGVQVLIDRDLAFLYQVEVKQMNRQVKRNIERFPADFMFQLTKEEYDGLKCQNGTSNISLTTVCCPCLRNAPMAFWPPSTRDTTNNS